MCLYVVVPKVIEEEEEEEEEDNAVYSLTCASSTSLASLLAHLVRDCSQTRGLK